MQLESALEELLEIITFKQLHLHNKPIVLMNIDRAFQGLIQQFEYCYDKSLVKPEYRDLYFVTDSVAEAMAYITSYGVQSEKVGSCGAQVGRQN